VKAFVQTGHGGPEVCAFADIAEPTPTAGQVLLRVEAAGLNRLDLLQRDAPLVRGFSLPHIAGMDVVGTVLAHGPDVGLGAPAVGDVVILDPVTTCRVCRMCTSGREPYCQSLQTVGSTMPGGFAEYVTAPADRCWPVPSHVSVEQAAAVPVAYMTAWQSLVRVGRVTDQDVVLVNGANAGVSIAAIQLARHFGATVIGTVRGAERIERLLAVGCHHVIESSDPSTLPDTVRALTNDEGVTLVIDHLGPAQFAPSIASLGVEGRMVFCGTTTGVHVDLALTDVYWWGRQLLGAGGYRPGDMAPMLEAMAASKLIPVVDEVAPFDELPRMLERMEHGSFVGKLVVRMR
jgi:NADPH:quinone reductase-like Zn-dependent oxidoreductase